MGYLKQKQSIKTHQQKKQKKQSKLLCSVCKLSPLSPASLALLHPHAILRGKQRNSPIITKLCLPSPLYLYNAKMNQLVWLQWLFVDFVLVFFRVPAIRIARAVAIAEKLSFPIPPPVHPTYDLKAIVKESLREDTGEIGLHNTCTYLYNYSYIYVYTYECVCIRFYVIDVYTYAFVYATICIYIYLCILCHGSTTLSLNLH